MVTHIRSSMDGDLAHAYDCIEVQSDSLAEALEHAAKEVRALEQHHGVVLGVQVREDACPQYVATAYVYVADAGLGPLP